MIYFTPQFDFLKFILHFQIDCYFDLVLLLNHLASSDVCLSVDFPIISLHSSFSNFHIPFLSAYSIDFSPPKHLSVLHSPIRVILFLYSAD